MKRTIFIFLMLLAIKSQAQQPFYSRMDTGSVNEGDSICTFQNLSDYKCSEFRITGKTILNTDIFSFYGVIKTKHTNIQDTFLLTAKRDSVYDLAGVPFSTGHVGTVSWRILSGNVDYILAIMESPSGTTRRKLTLSAKR
jgi:hypothetical protein